MLLHSIFVLVLTFILYQLYLVLKNAINYGIAYTSVKLATGKNNSRCAQFSTIGFPPQPVLHCLMLGCGMLSNTFENFKEMVCSYIIHTTTLFDKKISMPSYILRETVFLCNFCQAKIISTYSIRSGEELLDLIIETALM